METFRYEYKERGLPGYWHREEKNCHHSDCYYHTYFCEDDRRLDICIRENYTFRVWTNWGKNIELASWDNIFDTYKWIVHTRIKE